MTTISWVAVLREWFGAERYARDYEYLDANYRKQAEAVAALLPDAAGSGGEALHIRARKADEVAKRTAGDDLPDATQTREAELVAALGSATAFCAYNASDPLAIRFEFTTGADRLAAANAVDEALLLGGPGIRAALNGRGGA